MFESAWRAALEEATAQQGEDVLVALAESLGGDESGSEAGSDTPVARIAAALRTGKICPWAFVTAAESALGQGDPASRRFGAYSTPRALAEQVVEMAYAAGTSPPTRRQRPSSVLDPACGAGHLLLAWVARSKSPARSRSPVTPSKIFGWDLRPAAVAATKIALWLAFERRVPLDSFSGVTCRDGLGEPLAEAVDHVVANPPFVSIRRLAKRWGVSFVSELRRAFPSLSGNFDLWVPFVLSLERWVRPDGAFAIVLPMALWSADYAQPARELLAVHLLEVLRLRDRHLFGGAAVTVQIVSGRCASRPTGTTRPLKTDRYSKDDRSDLGPDDQPLVTPSVVRFSVTDRPGASRQLDGVVPRRFASGAGYPPAARVARDPASYIALREVAQVQCGTTGYQAALVGSQLVQGRQLGALPFIVTRSIDPYIVDDKRPVRFQGRTYERPHLPLAGISAGKRSLFEGEKIVVAGVGRRLEASRDRGSALGVNVFAISDLCVAVELILGLINSSMLWRWYQLRFAGRELSNGYFAVNATQLRAVPVPRRWLTTPAAPEVRVLVQAVRRREACKDPDAALEAHLRLELDREIERLLEGQWPLAGWPVQGTTSGADGTR